MKRFTWVVSAVIAAAALLGCAKHENAVDKAVDGAKDALNVRDNEKLKDAAEDVRDAAKDAATDVKSAAQGAASDAKEAAHDAAQAAKDAAQAAKDAASK